MVRTDDTRSGSWWQKLMGFLQELKGELLDIRFSTTRDADRLFTLLILTDALLIVLHILHTYTGLFADPNYSISQDRGYGEMFEYYKEFWVVLILFFMAVRRSNPLYLGWTLLFAYLLVDDSFRLHEDLGRGIANLFGYVSRFGLRANDFGELTVSAVAGTVLFTLIGTAHYFADRNQRNFSKKIFVLLLGLVFFGVGVDMLGVVIGNPIMDIIEDGGEMVMVTVITWFVFRYDGKERAQFAP